MCLSMASAKSRPGYADAQLWQLCCRYVPLTALACTAYRPALVNAEVNKQPLEADVEKGQVRLRGQLYRNFLELRQLTRCTPHGACHVVPAREVISAQQICLITLGRLSTLTIRCSRSGLELTQMLAAQNTCNKVGLCGASYPMKALSSRQYM